MLWNNFHKLTIVSFGITKTTMNYKPSKITRCLITKKNFWTHLVIWKGTDNQFQAPFVFQDNLQRKLIFFFFRFSIILQNISFQESFECTGYISDYLPKLNWYCLGLVFCANFLNDFFHERFLYIIFYQLATFRDQTLFTSPYIKQFELLNFRLDTRRRHKL